MSSKHIGGDINYAFPTAEIAVMGPEGAVNILFRNKLKSEQERLDKVEEYRVAFANPYRAAELGFIDEIIFPKQTRFKLYQALELTETKTKNNPPKKHGNMPL